MPSVITASTYPSLWQFRPAVGLPQSAFTALLGAALDKAADYARANGVRPPDSIISRVEWFLANKDQERSIWRNLLRPLWLADWFEAHDKPKSAAAGRNTAPLEIARKQQQADKGLPGWVRIAGLMLGVVGLLWWSKRSKK